MTRKQMIDWNKVITGLDCCSAMCGAACRKCPYNEECCDVTESGMAHLAADALTVIKKQQETIESLQGKNYMLNDLLSVFQFIGKKDN